MSLPKPGPHDSRGSDERESPYAINPNTHQPQPSGPTEPSASPKSGDLMIGEDTGGQDHFSGGMSHG